MSAPERIGVGVAMVMASVYVLLLSGCLERPTTPDGQIATSPEEVQRAGPDQFGVVCYRFLGREGISCVQVKQ